MLGNQQPSLAREQGRFTDYVRSINIKWICILVMEENKSFYERAKELAESCKRVKDNGVYETLSEEYHISKRQAGDRFKSFFGKPVRDYITDFNRPTREALRDALIKCDRQEELLKYLGITYDWLKGLYDKYFGTSTFRSAKLKLYNEFDVIPYNPTIEDNLSILVAERLGDGSFEFYDGRKSLKIEHSEEQYDWLKFKVNLLKKAFPTVPGLEAIKKRDNNGYISYSWRSNTIRDRYMDIIKENERQDLVRRLTPFGWMVWYLDDGNLYLSNNSNQLSISIHEPNVREVAVKEMLTYGFKFSNYKECITLSDKLEIIKFLNCFVKPFIHLIPDCMEYKYVVKI